MKIEVGDYIEHTWDEHYGVVTKVVEKPYGMGVTLFAASSTGEVEEVTEGNFVADFGIGRSDHHIWAEGEQAEYDALRAKGRTLYDQIRTRLSLSHAQAIAITQEAVQA